MRVFHKSLSENLLIWELSALISFHIIGINGGMELDKKKYDRDAISKMYDIIELYYLLNKLTNEFYEEDYSKEYLLDMVGSMENIRDNLDRYRRKDPPARHSYYHGRGNSFFDKIIYYLKTLNED